MAEIRISLGVCPQTNVLFDELSVDCHLKLYGELKGMGGADLEAAIVDMLSQVALSEKRHAAASALSGGQKRKLCLAIALLSSPLTCFLDEPTSGMDPHSRRGIWRLLREQREGRTLVNRAASRTRGAASRTRGAASRTRGAAAPPAP